ncbi:hypothetical protein [Pontivivens insulae]|uniref:Uncharacterized protein n=1 Tax=Pontivivens insulae TaxID=1639689 RepID=A0A2R8A9L2_9RHOB|nr:hypothetical protein [Pontivivens insulae]RED12821.1 hypothetical protein DFR53_1952 [Pontivivens insulae]SPF28912.1 hypothetical protein POI8812_01215 [Pontivivens insulae]
MALFSLSAVVKCKHFPEYSLYISGDSAGKPSPYGVGVAILRTDGSGIDPVNLVCMPGPDPDKNDVYFVFQEQNNQKIYLRAEPNQGTFNCQYDDDVPTVDSWEAFRIEPVADGDEGDVVLLPVVWNKSSDKPGQCVIVKQGGPNTFQLFDYDPDNVNPAAVFTITSP